MTLDHLSRRLKAFAILNGILCLFVVGYGLLTAERGKGLVLIALLIDCGLIAAWSWKAGKAFMRVEELTLGLDTLTSLFALQFWVLVAVSSTVVLFLFV